MEWNGRKLTIVGGVGVTLSLLLSLAYGFVVGVFVPENTLENDVGVALLTAALLVSLVVLLIGAAWWIIGWAGKELKGGKLK